MAIARSRPLRAPARRVPPPLTDVRRPGMPVRLALCVGHAAVIVGVVAAALALTGLFDAWGGWHWRPDIPMGLTLATAGLGFVVALGGGSLMRVGQPD